MLYIIKMTSANAGKVNIVVLPCSKLPDLSVVVGFDAPKCNWFALRKLKREKQTTDPQYQEGASITALCYAVYKSIEYKLKGEPTSLKKYGVSTMDCACQNGQFLIRFNCPGRLSSLVRCLNDLVQLLTPARCNPGFKHACRNLNCKPDDKAFGELERQINKGVQIFAVGKVTLKAPKPRAGPGKKKGGEVHPDVAASKADADTAARYKAMTRKSGGSPGLSVKDVEQYIDNGYTVATGVNDYALVSPDRSDSITLFLQQDPLDRSSYVYHDSNGQEFSFRKDVNVSGGGDEDDVDEVTEDDEKAGGGPVTADEAKKCCEFVAAKLNGKFPKLDGAAGAAEYKAQGFTEHDVHYDIRCKPGLAAFLTASYIESSSECAVDVISGTIVVWIKSFDGKLRTISEKDAIKRWVSGKFDKLKELTVPFVIYFMMNNDHRDCPDVDVLVKAAKNGMGELVSEISGCLKA